MKFIPLTKGFQAMVDDEDYQRVSQFKWCASETSKGRFYALRNEKGRHVYLHRFILNADRVDHRDGNGLNCQRQNLRECTQLENTRNQTRIRKHSTPFKGVSFDRRSGKFGACIQFNKRKKFLGYYHFAREAAKAYDLAALALFGPFARTNQQLGVIW